MLCDRVRAPPNPCHSINHTHIIDQMPCCTLCCTLSQHTCMSSSVLLRSFASSIALSTVVHKHPKQRTVFSLLPVGLSQHTLAIISAPLLLVVRVAVHKYLD